MTNLKKSLVNGILQQSCPLAKREKTLFGWSGETLTAICQKDGALLIPDSFVHGATEEPKFAPTCEILNEIARDDKWIRYSALHRLLGKQMLIRVLNSRNPADFQEFQEELKSLSANESKSSDGSVRDFGLCENGYPYAVFTPEN
jgi:hypothetical protein